MKQFLIFAACIFLLASCKRGFEPIEYGKDACAHCKMTIVDDRYAAEALTEKGRAYKFDDVLCMKQYVGSSLAGKNMLFVEDYRKGANTPLDAEKAIYLKHEFFNSPMNGDYAAFASEDEAKQFMDSLQIPILRWGDIE
ncbi:MAG TPA: nitrous oxide reductase accessory protein NosL [Flavipsychrobacter sp.]|nr:nitrous oxide reductase accessory protein NosL [Flavipsychrobacter sp.]